MKIIMKILLTLCKWICGFMIWVLLMIGIPYFASQLQKENYMPSDTPSAEFMVAVKLENQDDYRPKGWEYLQYGDLPFTKPDENCMEDCLRQLENGNYVYILETAGYKSHSEYQIKDNRIIPISFTTFHLGHMLLGMVGAFFVFWLYSYFRQIYSLRKDKTALLNYHYRLFKQLAIFTVIVAIGWTLIYFNAK